MNLVSFGDFLKLFTFLLKEFSHSMRFFPILEEPVTQLLVAIRMSGQLTSL